VFFRRIEVVGLEHVPASPRPVIFCGNHPNSLLDPMLVTVFCGRMVHFAAKDTLFKSRILRWLLGVMGAVPIQRRSDHAEGALANEETFERLYEVLFAGGTMGIFPEGLSHESSRLARLKTGAARIALGAAARRPEAEVCLVPVGLTYMNRHRFRSNVLIQFGPPIPIGAERLEAHAADPKAAAVALTDGIERSIQSLTVNAEDWETLRLLDAVRRLYQPPRISLEERVELARRFNRVYPEVRERPEVQALVGRVRGYLGTLEALGLQDRDLARPLGVWEGLRKVGGCVILVTVWLPLAALGAVLHVPLALLLGLGSPRMAPRKDVVGTTKFLLGVALSLLSYLGAAIGVGVATTPELGLGTAVHLPATGYALIRTGDRLLAMARVSRGLWRLMADRGSLGPLRDERAALEGAIVEAVERFHPADMKLLFPRPAGAEGDPS
jgi:1-acyl-sn-glycerol-3-phosphate acyltransferase